ncbi:MAG: hypothetical protein MJ164_03575, partial [Alphaproteobacteria bacterium]|nr:hypothetical protein [Alphaproteobacteria bacterium]
FATLPAGYTELEYIESTGTQYIDTRIKGDLDTEITFVGSSNKNTGTFDYQAFGSYDPSFQSLAITANLYRQGNWRFGNSVQTVNNSLVANQKFTIKRNKEGGWLDDSKVCTATTSTQFETIGNLFIFNVKEDSTSSFTGKCYSYKHLENGTLVRNFIPAKRDSDGEIGMYDIAWDGTQYGVVDLGTLNWSYGSGAFQTRVEDADNSYLYLDECYCSKYPAVHGQSWDNVHNGQIGMAGKSIRIKDSSFGTDTTAFKQAVSGVYLYYQRTTDTEFHGPFYTNSGAGTFIAGPVIIDPDSEIKIATTKMVDEEFAQAEANLAATVQTIESVVSRTITQTGQIATLHETKQTRPDENCPANMKCLLVQDEDGTPHWYPIIEP